MVLAAHRCHERSVPAYRHSRLGQGDLGDSADRLSLSRDPLYLISQSRGMAERRGQQAQQAREELRRVVGFSVADEIGKLDQLKKLGSITDQEFARLRAKLVS